MTNTYTLRNIARYLRKNPTRAEALLWERLRARRLEGLKFRRQHPIDGYIADFACPGERIVIEAEGSRHGSRRTIEKVSHLRRRGYRVLRFWDEEIITNMGGVLEEIRRNCQHGSAPQGKTC